MNRTKHEQKGYLNGVDRFIFFFETETQALRFARKIKRVMLILWTLCARLPYVAPARGRGMNSKWIRGLHIKPQHTSSERNNMKCGGGDYFAVNKPFCGLYSVAGRIVAQRCPHPTP